MTIKHQPRATGGLGRAQATAAGQCGAITFRQAVQAGMSTSAVTRMGAREWARVLPGVYLTQPGGTEQDFMAALLWAGPDAVLSHRAAAQLHGLDGFDESGAELTLPVGLSKRHPRLIVHRADVPPSDRTRIRGFPTTGPLRTLIDLAGSVDLVTLSAAFEHAWRTRRASPALLEQRLARGDAGRRGAAALKNIARDALERGRPMESILEVRLWWMLKEGGLPQPDSQYEVPSWPRRKIRLDFAYPRQGLAIETDSMAFHGDKQYFLAHCDRLTRLAAEGWRVMHFTKDKLADESQVLDLVRKALSQRKPDLAATSTRRPR